MKILVAADDFGLTRTNTDTILEGVDGGRLGQVSILANGEAVDYALAAYATRAARALLNLHVNLTEGPSLSGHAAVPLLTDANGYFTYSVAGLGLAYAMSGTARRAAFREQVLNEVRAQRARIGGADAPLRIDGHQHVHMLPFVFDTVLASGPVSHVRIPREPWYAWSAAPFLRSLSRVPAFLALQLCARRNASIARRAGIPHADAFVGVLYSGHMNYESCAAGLSQVLPAASSVELLLHPGSVASCSELGAWQGGRADLSWHLAPERAQERALLYSDAFARLLAQVPAGYGFSPWKLVRFGVSGVAAAAIDLSVLYLLTARLGLWYLASAVIAFLCGFAVSYTLQKTWTFRSSGAHAVHGPLYLALQLANLCVNTLALYVAVSILGFPYLIAQFALMVCLAVSSFFLMGAIFRHDAPATRTQEGG